MKKLLAFVFVTAAVLVGTNVLSSCKDYDGDNYDDLQIQLDRNDATLRQLITNNYNELYNFYTLVDNAQKQCSINCSNKHAELQGLIDQLVQKDIELQNAINTKADQSYVDSLKGVVDGIKSDIQGILNRLTTLENNTTTLSNTLTTITNSITTIENNISTITGAAQVDQQNLEDLISRVVVNEGNISTLLTTVNTINSTITELQSQISTISEKFDNYYTKDETDSLDSLLNVKIDSLKTYVDEKFVTLENRVEEVAADATDALELAKQDSAWVKELEKVVEQTNTALNARIDSLADVVANLNIPTIPEIPEAYNDSLVRDSIQKNTQAIEQVSNDLKDYIEKNDARVDSLAQVTDNLAELIEQAEQNRKDADLLLQQQINALVLAMNGQGDDLGGLRDSVNNILNVKLPAIDAAYKAADEALQEEIDALDTRVTQNAADIQTLSGKIDDLTDRMTNAEKKIADLEKKMNQITGIIPQATYNPVFGTFSAPAGISSKVLVAFYGEIGQMVEFPTDATANYVKNSDKFTAKDWDMIKDVVAQEVIQQGTIISGEENQNGKGKAGTLYLTINPSEVDFAGQTLKLVNSKDEDSKVVLSALEKENDYELRFGYTRAAADNGFYKAEATLDAADINDVKADIDAESYRTAFSKILNQRTATSVGELALKVYDQFNGIIPAQALKAEWTATLEDNSTYTRTFRSDYGIAATAIKPLSYNFLEDVDYQTLPGYEKAIAFINNMSNEVKNIISESWPNLTSFDASSIALNKIGTIDPERFKVTFSMSVLTDGIDSRAARQTIGDIDYLVIENRIPNGVDLSGNVNAYKWTTAMKIALNDEDATAEQDANNPLKWNLTITKTVGNVQDVFGSVDGTIDAVADFVDDVNAMLADINNVETSINTNLDTAIDKIRNIIDRINNRGVSFINSANRRLQPILLLTGSTTGTRRVSPAQGQPTVVTDATVTLIPTSYTADILTPAYKKHLAVVNVFKGSASAQNGDADCLAALNEVNDQVAKTVYPGETRSIDVTFKSGYTYEIAYSALDYAGKISMYKSYLKY